MTYWALIRRVLGMILNLVLDRTQYRMLLTILVQCFQWGSWALVCSVVVVFLFLESFASEGPARILDWKEGAFRSTPELGYF